VRCPLNENHAVNVDNIREHLDMCSQSYPLDHATYVSELEPDDFLNHLSGNVEPKDPQCVPPDELWDPTDNLDECKTGVKKCEASSSAQFNGNEDELHSRCQSPESVSTDTQTEAGHWSPLGVGSPQSARRGARCRTRRSANSESTAKPGGLQRSKL